MELSNRINTTSVLVLKPRTVSSLSLKQKSYTICKEEKEKFSIIKKVIIKNIIDLSKISYLDGLIYFKKGGYFS